MRHFPSKEYSGLTIVMSQPSRQDKEALLSGYAGLFFNNDCLAPKTSRWRCDIRTADTLGEGLLDGTKGLLLLGERALHDWTIGYSEYSINELRGTPLRNKWNLPCICSYSPQDAIDPVDHENRLNPLLAKEIEESSSGGDEEIDTKKRHGRTRRNNYRFFLTRDVQKILWGIENPELTKPKEYPINIYPELGHVLEVLNTHKNDNLYLDIETDRNKNMLCFGFSFDAINTIYTVPIVRYDYTLAYGENTWRVLKAIVMAIRNNTSVIHNSSFDSFVLSTKYSIPFNPNFYDTMLSQHRCFPEAEKSLGHCLSVWPDIWEPFHKDEGIFEPQNLTQEKQLWQYNAKDVAAMKWIRRAQLDYAKTKPGLEDSIEQSNSCIYSFLLNTLQGIRFDESKRKAMIDRNDKLMNHYQRAINYLIGDKIELLPTSSKSCVRYFHDALGYPIVGRSKKTGEPSLDEMNLLKLKQKFPFNATIDFCIAYRQRKKETGSLNFTPWKTDERN